MGTQFNSRITPGDRARILAGIVAVTTKVRSRARGAAGRPGGALSARQERQLGDSMAAQVLVVAEERHFSSDLEQSRAFLAALDWLKKLQTTAKYDPKAFVGAFKLETAPSPTQVLIQALRDLLKEPEGQKADPFRQSSTTAAIAVLGHVMTAPIGAKPGESPAQQFQRKLQSLELREVVNIFVRQFLIDAFAKLLHGADPNQGQPAVQQAIQPVEKSLGRAAKRAVDRIQKAGKLTDTGAIRGIVAEELRQVLDANLAPVSG